MAKVKKSIKKAEDGKQVPNPKYTNLKMGVANKRTVQGVPTKDGLGASREDSSFYRFGYNRGLKGEKGYPGEPAVQKAGRWEGQNAKKAAPEKKKAGGSLKPVAADKKKSLGKLPEAVRHQMGYQKNGGKVKAKSGASMKKCKYGCK